MAFGQLQVVFGFGGLVPGGDFTVSPIGVFQGLTDALHFLAREQAGNVQHHEAIPESTEALMVLILIRPVKRRDG
jgi:hypothetical protein